MVDGLESTVIFNQLKEHVSSSPDIVKKVKSIFMWNITKDGKTVAKWSKRVSNYCAPSDPGVSGHPNLALYTCPRAAADLKNGSGSIFNGEPTGEKPACTFTMADKDFVALAMGQMDPQQVRWWTRNQIQQGQVQSPN